jgi:hypothetical protein
MANLLRSLMLCALIHALPAFAHSCQNELHLSDGKLFQIESVVSNDGKYTVYLLTNGTLLRVAKDDPQNIIRHNDGFRGLAERHIPVPRRLGFNRGLWAVSQFEEIEFFLSDVLKKGSEIGGNRFALLVDEFAFFAFKFATLNKVGGLSARKIAYVKNKGWMIIDWLADHQSGITRNPFDDVLDIMDESLDLERVAILREASASSLAAARGR